MLNAVTVAEKKLFRFTACYIYLKFPASNLTIKQVFVYICKNSFLFLHADNLFPYMFRRTTVFPVQPQIHCWKKTTQDCSTSLPLSYPFLPIPPFPSAIWQVYCCFFVCLFALCLFSFHPSSLASPVRKTYLPIALLKWWLPAPAFWCKKLKAKWLTLSPYPPPPQKILIEVYLLCTVQTKNSVNYYILSNRVQKCCHFNQWVLKFQLSRYVMKYILKCCIIERYSTFYRLFLPQLQRGEFL